MAYDEDLADRIRELVGAGPGVSEQRMFGGLAFLVGGHLAISASGQGGVLVRTDPARAEELVAAGRAEIAIMGGRTMAGWLRVGAENLRADGDLEHWVRLGTDHARSLPPKAPKRQSMRGKGAGRTTGAAAPAGAGGSGPGR